MSRKFLGFLAFVATGGGLLGGTILNSSSPVVSIGVFAVMCLFAIGLVGHYKELLK